MRPFPERSVLDGGLQRAIEPGHIVPSAEFAPNSREHADSLEAQTLMKGDARVVGRGDAGDRALAGALAGGTAGAVKGGIDSRRISPMFQRFVEQCLRDRGYQVIGWQ